MFESQHYLDILPISGMIETERVLAFQLLTCVIEAIISGHFRPFSPKDTSQWPFTLHPIMHNTDMTPCQLAHAHPNTLRTEDSHLQFEMFV